MWPLIFLKQHYAFANLQAANYSVQVGKYLR